jgi:hypothetical protein
MIRKLEPEIVFLDVHMHARDGFPQRRVIPAASGGAPQDIIGIR